jgi:hypothetical protein
MSKGGGRSLYGIHYSRGIPGFNLPVLLLVILLTSGVHAHFDQVRHGVGDETIFNVQTVLDRYDRKKTFIVRVCAATFSAVSMAASLVSFYWFSRMEKRFRHR